MVAFKRTLQPWGVPLCISLVPPKKNRRRGSILEPGQLGLILDICLFFYTSKIFWKWNLPWKLRSSKKKLIPWQNSVKQDLMGQALRKVNNITYWAHKVHFVYIRIKENMHKLHQFCVITHFVAVPNGWFKKQNILRIMYTLYKPHT